MVEIKAALDKAIALAKRLEARQDRWIVKFASLPASGMMLVGAVGLICGLAFFAGSVSVGGCEALGQ